MVIAFYILQFQRFHKANKSATLYYYHFVDHEHKIEDQITNDVFGIDGSLTFKSMA